MSLDLQFQSVHNQVFNTVVISEINPEAEYYIQPSSVDSGAKTATFSGKSWGTDDYADCVLIALTGSYRCKCYTIVSNTATVLTLRIDEDTTFASEITTSLYYAIIYTARAMYAYCQANSKDCISLACKKVGYSDTLGDEPLSLPVHTTPRVGTGTFNQTLSLTEVDFVHKNPLYKLWKLQQFRELFYHWGQLDKTTSVYLIVTAEYTHPADGYLYLSNWDGKKKDATNGTYSRGYLKGFLMTNSGEWEFNPSSTIRFSEAWDD